jgi:hypothetical protein
MVARRHAVHALSALAAAPAVLLVVACATSPAEGGVDPGADGGAPLHSPDGRAADGAAPTGDGSGPDAPPPVTGAKRVFATKGQRAGDFGGVAGADAICQQAASALGGTWKAWLSDGVTRAGARIAAVGPWSLVDGTPAFPLATVTSPVHDLDMDEDGQTGARGLVWTGTAPGGAPTADTCSGWTSKGQSGTSGYPHLTNQWTDDGTGGSPCSLSGRLYCFEQ